MKDIKCPWCNCRIPDPWDYFDTKLESGYQEATCGSCDNPIVINQSVLVQYSAQKDEEPKEDDE